MPEEKLTCTSRFCLAWSLGMLIASALGTLIAIYLSSLTDASDPPLTTLTDTGGNLRNQSESETMTPLTAAAPSLNASSQREEYTATFLYFEEYNDTTTDQVADSFSSDGATANPMTMVGLFTPENHSVNFNGSDINSTSPVEDKFDMKLSRAELIENSVFLVLLLPIALFGNILTICVTRRMLKKRKSPADFLIGTLAASDLLVTLVVHSQSIASMAAGEWLGGQTTCSIQSFFCWSFWKTSFFCIQCLTIERFLVFSKPFFYRVHVTMTKVKVLVVLILLTSFSSSLGTVTSHTDSLQLRPGWYLCINDWTLINSYFFSLLIVNGLIFVIGIIVFSFSNAKVVAIMLKAKKFARNNSVMSSKSQQERRFAWLIIAISIIFLIFWVPYWLFIVLHQIDAYHDLFAENIAIRILFYNSLINPVLYAAFRQIYRQGYWYYTKLTFHYLTCTLISKPQDVFKSQNQGTATTVSTRNNFSHAVKKVQISQKVLLNLRRSDAIKETDSVSSLEKPEEKHSDVNFDGNYHQPKGISNGYPKEEPEIKDDSGVETGEECFPAQLDKGSFTIAIEDNLPINENEHMTKL